MVRAHLVLACSYEYTSLRLAVFYNTSHYLKFTGERAMEAFEISARFELLDECSDMRGDGSRESVVLVLEALPNC